MQPLQCVSQHPIANLHVSTHIATENMTTIMQPCQCDLQTQIQETNRTTHTDTTTRCRTQRRNQNDPSRNRRTQEVPFIAACSHFTRKNTRFRAPASSPKQSPCIIHAAITMHFAASRRKPARIYAHSNRAWQQSCSHSNAICNHGFKKRIELRTQEQPLVLKHREGTSSPLPFVTTSLPHHFL